MANACAKCGAELIGSRKFCAACGTPVGDARALGSAELESSSTTKAPTSLPVLVPGVGAPVNPFAATAPPNTMSPMAGRSSSYGPAPDTGPRALSETETDPNALPVLPTPASGDPGSLVSPLAVSSVVTQGEGVDSARKQLEAAQQSPDAALSRKAPGTQLMPSIPRPGGPVSAATPSAKRQDRTHVMSAFDPRSLPSPQSKPNAPSTSKMPVAPPAAGSSPASGPASQPGAQQHQPHHGAPAASARGSAPPAAHGYPMPPSQPHAAGWSGGHAPPPVSAVPQTGAPPWSHAPAYPPASPPMPPAAPWSAHTPAGPHAPPSYGYPSFGYAPGTRVLVTWSTGQRYPATVQQVTGTQCLVLFPDGQQHWVDMQYVSPGG